MLQETGLPYETKIISKHDRGEEGGNLSAITPAGTFPAIVDTDTGATVFESAAVLYYLADKAGKLLPSNSRDKADVMKWLLFEAANICPVILEIHHYIMNDTGDLPGSILERYQSMLVNFCEILEKQLNEREFLAGELSIADIALHPWMVTLQDMADININEYPNLSRWAVSINKRYE